MAATPDGFGFGEAVKLFTALIPQDNTAFPIPDEDGLVGQFDKRSLLTQFLHLLVCGDIMHHTDHQKAIWQRVADKGDAGQKRATTLLSMHILPYNI
jgi:hypothetical protein